MRHFWLAALLSLAFLSVPSLADPPADLPPVVTSILELARQVNSVLDDFHEAASQADGERYFGLFAPHGIFLGTDLSERWTVEEFKAYAMPYFSQGRGWTYHPVDRHIYLADDGQTAWFDETLQNDKYGMTRGSGVLVLREDGWKVAQYHLTLPVPNELIEQLVQQIEAQSQRP
jgi:hypothetical protein